MRRGRVLRPLTAAALLLAGLFAAVTLPDSASAHPLGNFTINHLSQVRISQGSVEVHYILDQAEIPTFQEIQRFDRDGDGAISGSERGPLLQRKLAEIGPDLQLTVDGRDVALGAPRTATLSYPPGQGGLSLTRVEAGFTASIPPGAHRVQFHDDTYSDRVGWKAIEVLPGEGTDVRSSVPASDPTGGLRAYPVDLLQSPPDQREAAFAVSEGSGRVSAPDAEDVGPVTTDRAQDGFAGALTSANDHGLLILLLLGSAFVWGALHALSPGHGKTMVAGYLAGSRGRAKDAALLGLTVTITHTSAVFALGLITLAASAYVLPEDLYPWLGVASGAMVIAIGLWAIWTRLRRWRAIRAEHDHGHHRVHSHGGHTHTHSHSHSHDHAHARGSDHHPLAGRPGGLRGDRPLPVGPGGNGRRDLATPPWPGAGADRRLQHRAGRHPDRGRARRAPRRQADPAPAARTASLRRPDRRRAPGAVSDPDRGRGQSDHPASDPADRLR